MTFTGFKGVSQHLEPPAAEKNSPGTKGRMGEASSSQTPRGEVWVYCLFLYDCL